MHFRNKNPIKASNGAGLSHFQKRHKSPFFCTFVTLICHTIFLCLIFSSVKRNKTCKNVTQFNSSLVDMRAFDTKSPLLFDLSLRFLKEINPYFRFVGIVYPGIQ